ncbi:MAG: glycosyltransferase [Acidimicrobiales bacterium]
MPGVLMVEWLGRGGFAHTAESWFRELSRTGGVGCAGSDGGEIVLVTRAGRELAHSVKGSVAVGGGAGPVGAHVAILRTALRLLRDRSPMTLVLHGTVLPQLELPLIAAARRRGSLTVLVAHEAVTGRSSPGSSAFLARMVRSADVVVVHSRFIASELEKRTGRTGYRLLPLPLPLGLVTDRGDPVVEAQSVVPATDGLLALHFGHLHRRYKGTSSANALAAEGVPGWRFALVGKGAPAGVTSAASATVVDRFLEPAELVATVASADAVLLPYERASQSAAVVLAQALGAVVVASGVGGIPEQVEEGRTGLLLSPGAGVREWVHGLERLRDEALRGGIATTARESVVSMHGQFVEGITRIIG